MTKPIMLNEIGRGCSGTGRTPKVDEAVARIEKAAIDPNDVEKEIIHGEDGVSWADVMAVVRDWKRLVRVPAWDD